MRLSSGLLLLLLVYPIICWPQGGRLPQPTRWPQDRTAAISLTFDDSMESQLDNAGPVIGNHDLRGTIFVITGPSSTWRGRHRDWQRLAAGGQEVGSHTVTHPCLLAEIEPHSQDYSPERMQGELRESAREITALLGTRRGLTFAYPCGNMSFGPPAAQVRNQALYIDDVAESYFAARGYGGGGSVTPEELNILTVPDLGPTAGKNFPDLLAMMEPAIRQHQWGIFAFHGVGGEWLSVSTETLDELASYLQRHTEILTAPFGDVIRYIQESQALGIQATGHGDQQAQFSLDWPLDAKVFDLPLTLKWQFP